MYSIVIADDEERIVQLIRRLIDTRRLDVEIVGEAYDGRQALSLVRSLHPDILITDIRMPDVDGLKLIEQLRRESLNTSVIALSGYRSFDYAYNALKYGVEDFIVKPIKEKELNTAIEKACRHVGALKNRAEPRDYNASDQRLGFKMHEYLMNLLVNEENIGMTLDELNREYALHFASETCLALAVCANMTDDQQCSPLVMEKIVHLLRDGLGRFCDDAAVAAAENAVLCIANIGLNGDKMGLPSAARKRAIHVPAPQAMDITLLMPEIRRLYDHLAIALDNCANLVFSMGVSEVIHGIEQLPDIVRRAWLCAKVKYILGSEQIYYANKLDTAGMQPQLSGSQTEEFRRIIDNGQCDRLRKWYDHVFCETEQKAKAIPLAMVSRFEEVVRFFHQICKVNGIAPAGGANYPLPAPLLRADNYADTREAVLNYMLSTLETDRTARLKNDSYPIILARKYMRENMGRPIRLEDVARHVSLSASYLSMLFKKEMGECFSDYLTNIRLDEAKRLLKTTTLSVGEISETVGYQEAKHFSKVFKKQIGVRPTEYRRMYQL